MTTRKIKPLPVDLTWILFDLGPRKLVLVEGADDVEVFQIWYRDRRSQIEFYAAEGYSSVEVFLTEILNYSSTRQAYGFIDRDFRSEAEVEAQLANPETRLFILRRYALENYLLDPRAVFEELSLLYPGQNLQITDVSDMTRDLLNLCSQLKPIMAANWVFWDENLVRDTNRINYFSIGFPTNNRLLLIQEMAKKLEWVEAEAERGILEKETFLETALAHLDSAYCYIDGKRLLRLLGQTYHIPHLGHFRRLLARTTQQFELPPDIQTIVEKRILGRGGEEQAL